MLRQLRRENFKFIDVEIKGEYFLTDEDKLNIINNLTEKNKTIIRRDFILHNLSDAFRDDVTAELLKEFTRQHAPEKLTEIESKYSEEYEKRHKSIQEKIKVLN